MKAPVVVQKEEKKAANVNEEMFYDTKGNVLEIQPYIFKNQQESSEEDSSEEQPKKKTKPSAFQSANLGFEDIGYKAYEPSKPRYVVVKNDSVNYERNQQKPRQQQRQSCNCYKDLVVDQGAFSEQSTSFESTNDHQYNTRFTT